MATAAELLSNVVEEVLVIDSSLRTINIPPSVTNLGVESDDETTRLKFQMPRYNDGIDLKDFVVRINYENANGEGDIYTATDVATNDDTITFSWLVGRRAVMYKGTVKFIVCLKKFDAEIVIQEFNTTVATLPVLEGLEVDLMAQPHVEYDALSAAAYEAILLALDSDLKGEPGYTPVKGTDYYTSDERDEFKSEVIHATQGEYANAYKQTANGDVIRVDDVSPIEHTVGVNVKSKNMCPMSTFNTMYPNGSTTEYDATTHTITMIADATGAHGRYISPLKNLIVGETYTVSVDIKGTPGKKVKCGWDKNNISVTLTGEYVRYSSTITATHSSEAIIFYTKATADGGLSTGEYMQFDNVQVELGNAATEYSEYVDPSTVTLTRCGKNLLPLDNFTYTPSTSTATVVNGVLTVNGYIAARRISAAGLIGKQLTISCTSTRTGEKGGGLAVEFRDPSNTRISGVYHQNELSPKFPFTIPEGTATIVAFFYASGNADTVGTATYRNIQLELGDTVTDHELYTGDTYTPSTDGTVENVYSVSPTMTLFTDNPGVTIEAEYSANIKSIFDDVKIEIDEEVTENGQNPVTGAGIKTYVDAAIDNVTIEVADAVEEGGTDPVSGDAVYQALQNVEIDVDNEMSATSENPVQNKVAKAYIDNKLIEPMFIDGAVVENYYNPDVADIVEGKYIDPTGAVHDNATYMYLKVKLYSGKKYRINLANTYSVAVFDNGEISGNVSYTSQPLTTKAFELPEMEEKIVTAYITCTMTNFNNVGGNVIIVEGEELPTGDEQYRISYPWLYVPEEEEELVIPPYTVNEIALKQKMPPYLFDGIEMDNYFDVEYMVANSTQDTRYTNYYHTPYIYLPAGTYTINECYKYTPMSKDGIKGTEVSSGGTKNSATFTITEDNPYISFMIYCKGLDATGNALVGIEYLRKIAVQKGDTATEYVPNTYNFNEKFNFKGGIGYYPTHWDSKKYVAIGDSITFGYKPPENGVSGGGQMKNPYSKVVADNLNMERFNAGESGANVKCVLGLVSDYDNQVQQAIDFNADIITIMIGVNDSGAESTDKYVPLGTIDDVYDESNITFYSGLSEIVNRLQTALPNATIILLSSPKNNYTVTEKKQNYFNAVKKVAEKYDVLFYDIHNGCGFNINNETVVTNFVLTDVHPNEKAHKIIGSRLTGFIASH